MALLGVEAHVDGGAAVELSRVLSGRRSSRCSPVAVTVSRRRSVPAYSDCRRPARARRPAAATARCRPAGPCAATRRASAARHCAGGLGAAPARLRSSMPNWLQARACSLWAECQRAKAASSSGRDSPEPRRSCQLIARPAPAGKPSFTSARRTGRCSTGAGLGRCTGVPAARKRPTARRSRRGPGHPGG